MCGRKQRLSLPWLKESVILRTDRTQPIICQRGRVQRPIQSSQCKAVEGPGRKHWFFVRILEEVPVLQNAVAENGILVIANQVSPAAV